MFECISGYMIVSRIIYWLWVGLEYFVNIFYVFNIKKNIIIIILFIYGMFELFLEGLFLVV